MRVGLIGCGYWGKKIFGYLGMRPEVDSVYVSTEEEHNQIILEDPSIQKVFVATPIETHYQIVKECLRYGKDVMCEKDLTPSLQATDDLINTAVAERRQLLVDYIYSFNPQLPCVPDFTNIEVVMEHNGRQSEDVATVLGSHALAVAGQVGDIYNARLITTFDHRGSDYPRKSLMLGLTTTGGNWIKIIVSTEAVEKVRYVSVDGQRYDLDYEDGINVMIDKFFAGESNFQMAHDVARIVQATRR